MRTFFKIGILLPFFGALASCDPGAQKDNRLDSIAAMETQMLGKNELDTVLAEDMIEAYQSYIKDYPKDSLAPQFQQKTAEMYRAYPGKEAAAIEAYKVLFEKYGYYEEGAKGLLALALFYEELQQKDLALATYKRFIERYPSHPLAQQAQQLMDLLADETLSDIQLVQQWMKKAKNKDQNSDK